MVGRCEVDKNYICLQFNTTGKKRKATSEIALGKDKCLVKFPIWRICKNQCFTEVFAVWDSQATK